jgi:hypothetical protein
MSWQFEFQFQDGSSMTPPGPLEGRTMGTEGRLSSLRARTAKASDSSWLAAKKRARHDNEKQIYFMRCLIDID